MSSVIEKITLYDLLGYTVPGTILVSAAVYLFYLRDHGEEAAAYAQFSGYLFTALVFLGYLAGIAVAEIFAVISSLFRKCGWFQKGNGIADIGFDGITKALIHAGVLARGSSVSSADQVMKHMGYMYGTVQADPKYARLHNYASSELVSGNMSMVSAVCAGMYVYITRDWRILVFGLLLAGIFLMNYHKMYWRKHFYVICWFVEKNQSVTG